MFWLLKLNIEVELLLQLDLLKNREKKFLLFLGRLDSINGTGVNILIKKGAILVTSPKDIINEIPELKNPDKIIIKHNTFIKREYRKIYNVLSDIPISLDEISIKTKNNIKCTLKLLSLMEIDDLIDELPGIRLC